jgi:hypothetical protein
LYMTPGRRQWEALHTRQGPSGSDWPGDSHGCSSYQAKTRTIVRWRWISESWLCGPKGPQISKTSEGLASQIDTPLCQSVRRPHLILARRLSETRQAMRTFPSSGSSMLMLMLVKWLWCGRRNSCSVIFFPAKTSVDLPWDWEEVR